MATTAGALICIEGAQVMMRVFGDLSFAVIDRERKTLWRSSSQHVPTMILNGDRSIAFGEAGKHDVGPYAEEAYRGYTLRLSGFGQTDAIVELVFAIDLATDEALIQVDQVGGQDVVRQVNHFYCIEKPTSAGGYMVLPHGSGYLIHADCPDELPGQCDHGGMIGARWTLPMFGMVRGDDTLCLIVDTWWDCAVHADHVPGDQSSLDFQWKDSLGKLAYARRFTMRFARGLDHVAMAKLYRQRAREQGLVRTLEDKAQQTPVIRRYIENVLVRWPAWNAEDSDAVLADLRKLKQMGIGVNFFFPKCSSGGYNELTNTMTTAHGNWQSLLHPNPVPGGWGTLSCFADQVRELGCPVQGFTSMMSQYPDGPYYDEERRPRDEQGQPLTGKYALSTHDDLDRVERMLDYCQAKGLKHDILYYDGYSAYDPRSVDYTPCRTVTRRQTYETQNACFALTRQRGIMPGAEAARFWCMGQCDYFFFTDWSRDRLTNTPTYGAPDLVGEPIPLFELVFGDCYIAGFSAGGYALYTQGYDWWSGRTPRLYELMFAAAPAHNWLPDGHVPIKDWNSQQAKARWEWLRRWRDYYQTVAMSQMISHTFLSDDPKQQRIEFANGVSLEIDLQQNLCRVTGVSSFTGQWETPAGNLGAYSNEPIGVEVQQ